MSIYPQSEVADKSVPQPSRTESELNSIQNTVDEFIERTAEIRAAQQDLLFRLRGDVPEAGEIQKEEGCPPGILNQLIYNLGQVRRTLVRIEQQQTELTSHL